MFNSDKAKRIQGAASTAQCYFNIDDRSSPSLVNAAEQDDSIGESMESVDFGPYIDLTPITVHPQLPLETVMDLFKKMGPRVILIEFAGRLVGLVTVKDVLKYIARTESRGRSQPGDSKYDYGASGADAWWEERYWGIGGRYSRVKRSTNDRNSLESEDMEMNRR